MNEIIVLHKSELVEIIRQELFNTASALNNQPPLEVMNVKQVCEYLKITYPTLKKGIKQKELPVSYALGENMPRFIKAEINEWLMKK